MRKFISLFLTVVLVLAFACYSLAGSKTREYNLYLTAATTGTTTSASGTSTMVVEGNGIDRSQGITTIHPMVGEKFTTIVFQLYDATPIPATGNTGASVTIGYKESIYDTTDHWAAAGATNFLSGILLSGTSRQIAPFSPTGVGGFRFHFISGVTPFSAVTGVVKFYSEN